MAVQELSKYAEIKEFITPDHPGVISYQRMVKADGSKTKEYPLWQTTIRGKKISRRITKDDAVKIQRLIDSARYKEEMEKNKELKMVKINAEAHEIMREKTRKLRSERMKELNKSSKKDKKDKKDKKSKKSSK